MLLVDPDSTVETQENSVVQTHILRRWPSAVEAVLVVLIAHQLLEYPFLQGQFVIVFDQERLVQDRLGQAWLLLRFLD